MPRAQRIFETLWWGGWSIYWAFVAYLYLIEGWSSMGWLMGFCLGAMAVCKLVTLGLNTLSAYYQRDIERMKAQMKSNQELIDYVEALRAALKIQDHDAAMILVGQRIAAEAQQELKKW